MVREMAKSVQGIVDKGAVFKSVVRKLDFVQVFLMNHADERMPNTKCRVTFQDGQTITAESDGEGVLRFPRKAPGELKIELLEEEEASTESREHED
jgi:hypothetical protein